MYRWLGRLFAGGAFLLLGAGLYLVLYPDGIPNSIAAGPLTVEEPVRDLGPVTVGAPREIGFRFSNAAGSPRPVVRVTGL